MPDLPACLHSKVSLIVRHPVHPFRALYKHDIALLTTTNNLVVTLCCRRLVEGLIALLLDDDGKVTNIASD